MAQKQKVAKILLHEYLQSLNTYRVIYPQTSGDLVIGQVSDSKKLDGKTADSYMPSVTSGYMEIKNDNNIPQGIISGRAVISDDINDNHKIADSENALWVKGRAYIQNGKEVATTNDIDNKIANLSQDFTSIVVKHSQTASKLNSNAKINGVVFNGDKDISVSGIIISPNTPTKIEDTNKLWINPTEDFAYYYYNNQWRRIITR